MDEDEAQAAEILSPLQRTFEWRNLFEQAEDFIAAKDYASAIETLRQALPISEEIGVEWMGYVETLERLGYSLYEYATESQHATKEKDLAEAESLLIQSLGMLERVQNIFEDVDQILMLRRTILTNLHAVLIALGKTDEAERRQAELSAIPGVIDSNEDPIETNFLTTLSVILHSLERIENTADATTAENILEQLIEQIRSIYGPNSSQAADAIQRMGHRAEMSRSRDKAEACYVEALRIRLQLLGRNHAAVAKSLRDLGNFYRSEAIGKGFMARARKIETELGLVNPVDLSLKVLSSASGIPQEMRDKLLLTSGDGQPQDVLDCRVDDYLNVLETKPPKKQPENLSTEQRYKRLVSMLKDTRSIVEKLEADEEYPLSTVCVLGELGQAHKRLGDMDEVRRLKQERLAIIARHWGEDHAMMREEQQAD